MIIGVCGCNGSGKDTIGDYLVNNCGFIKLSFANILKENVARLFCWDLEMCKGLTDESRAWREQVDEKWSEILGMTMTPRLALELGGTEGGRNIYGENIFVGHVKMSIDKLFSEGKYNIVITDCRFPNEMNMIKSYDNSMILHVYRDHLIPSWYNDYKNGVDVSEVMDMHPSKYMWIRTNFDKEISNNSTIEELYSKLLLLIN